MRKSILLIVCMLAVGMTANAQKFALIDMEYILQNIPAYERANEQLTQTSTRYQSEVEVAMKEAQTLFETYQSEAASLSDAQKTQREEAIIAKEKEANDLRRKYFGQDGEMSKLQASLISPIETEIYNVVKQISEQSGYSVVLDRASATSIIFASPRIDISNEVLSNLGYSN